MMKANITAYQQLCAIADNLKLPEKYKTDLYRIDREYLTGAMGIDAPDVFGYVFRDWGAELYDYRRRGHDLNVGMLRNFYMSTWDYKKCRFFVHEYGYTDEVTFEMFLARFHYWQCYYTLHWNPAWDSYFFPHKTFL